MEAMAKLRMAHNTWDYVAGGAADEITLRRNREAFDEIAVNPRYLQALTERDTSTTVLGRRIEMPVMAAPTGAQFLAHSEAEVAVARGAGAVGTLTTVATGASRTVEEVAEAASGPLWLQLYHLHDDLTEFMAGKAEAAGFSALCLTVDGVGTGMKERDSRNDFSPLMGDSWADLRERPDLLERARFDEESRSRRPTWEKLAWFRSITSMPLVVKGILTARDAVKCAEHGVDPSWCRITARASSIRRWPRSRRCRRSSRRSGTGWRSTSTRECGAARTFSRRSPWGRGPSWWVGP